MMSYDKVTFSHDDGVKIQLDKYLSTKRFADDSLLLVLERSVIIDWLYEYYIESFYVYHHSTL